MIGRRLAQYQIDQHLGSGGMGDVYQAVDSKLGRRVALKFIPEAATGQPERMARFEREARALALLNHPNIAAIYGLEEAEGRPFLVMEMVPGTTLADRVVAGPLPVEEAIGIARQIAEALESAHEKGIIHRDLKPANVKITPEGRVKVLDFGLAKLVAEAESEARTLATTVTGPVTVEGGILGTPAYMAPEQARGAPADKRADIFAFGCLLYEMVAGRRAFDGGSVADTLARVLQSAPDWTRLPPDVPPSVQRLVRLCLEKDPAKRRQSAGDVRIDLEQALLEPSTPTSLPASGSRARDPWRVPLLATLAFAAVAIVALSIPLVLRWSEPPPPETRLEISTPMTEQPMNFALSPDGRSVVFVARAPESDVHMLYLRSLDTTEARPIPGTEGAWRLPFWSSDGRSVGFFAAKPGLPSRLYRVDRAGGAPRMLAVAANPVGGTWSGDVILFGPDGVSPIHRVPASGGEAVPVTPFDPSRETHHGEPSFLPDGRRFLFRLHSADAERAGLYLGSLDGGVPKRLAASEKGAFLPPDHVVYLQDGLVAQRFDAKREELVGEPVKLAARADGFSVSASGVVAHRYQDPPDIDPTWFDREGNPVGTLPGGFLNTFRLSPDEHRLASERGPEGNRDVWIHDLKRGGMRPITSGDAADGYPEWSPDGSRIAFHTNRNGTFDIWVTSSTGGGPEQPLLELPEHQWPLDWSRDGRYLLYTSTDMTNWDLFALPLTGGDREPLAVAAKTRFVERMGQFSPDGQWVVYETNESGRPDVIAQAFPTPAGLVSVSTNGGTGPRWSADGRWIYFVSLDDKMMRVPVSTSEGKLEAGAPVELFPARIPQTFKTMYVVTGDERFLYHRSQSKPIQPLELILNPRLP